MAVALATAVQSTMNRLHTPAPVTLSPRWAIGKRALLMPLAAILLLGPSMLRADPILSSANQGPFRLPKRTPEIEKALTAFQQRDYDQCLRLLQEAATKNHDIKAPRLILAKLFLLDNQMVRGRATLEQASAESPEEPETYLVLGTLALQDNRVTDALLDYEKALALVQAGKLPEAPRRELLTEIYAGLEIVAERRKDWALAKRSTFAWLQLDAKNGKVRHRFGQALFRAGTQERAYEELQQAVKDDPSLEPPATTMGRLFAEARNSAKATEWMEIGVREAATDARAHAGYANYLLDQEQAEKAKAEAEKAAQLAPDSEEVKVVRGLAAWYLRDYETAERLFQDVYAASPANFLASNYLTLSLIEQSAEGKRRRALELAEINSRLYPNSSAALATVGWVYYRLGRLDDAERSLRAAVSGGYGSSDMAYFLARVLADRNKPDEVKQWLNLALKAPGAFAFRKDARQMLDLLAKKP
jgi:tetratricopeptide (TPR) repeat protein